MLEELIQLTRTKQRTAHKLEKTIRREQGNITFTVCMVNLGCGSACAGHGVQGMQGAT